jgi:hypothetical protein
VWLLVGVMLGLAGSGLMRVWPAAAQPQVLPNAADQRNAMVLELRATNAKLDAIHSLLASGKSADRASSVREGDTDWGGAAGQGLRRGRRRVQSPVVLV